MYIYIYIYTYSMYMYIYIYIYIYVITIMIITDYVANRHATAQARRYELRTAVPTPPYISKHSLFVCKA